ncbi:MAG: DUF6660 family protein [Ferruginibacter sp.]
MKIFAVIMSIYLLGLSCIPCGDKEERNAKGAQTISAIKHQHQHDNTNDACTPFCSCSCCPASAFFQPLSHFSIYKVVFPSKKYPVYNSSFCPQVSFSIWQPPKIA